MKLSRSLTVIFGIIATLAFIIVTWNLLLPLSGSQNFEFLDYLKYYFLIQYNNDETVRRYIDIPLMEPIQLALNSIQGGQNKQTDSHDFDVGPRFYDSSAPNYVTLTFYVEYGNHQLLPGLIDMLYQNGVDRAVFLLEKQYMDDHPFVVNTLRAIGYKVVEWDNFPEYSKRYPPTLIGDNILSGSELIGKVKKDSDAVSFIETSLNYQDDLIFGFSTKIMKHPDLLLDLLNDNKDKIIFVNGPSGGGGNESSTQNYLSTTPQTTTNIFNEILNFDGASTGQDSIRTDINNTTSSEQQLIPSSNNGTGIASSPFIDDQPLSIPNGNWTMLSLSQSFPSVVITHTANHKMFLINRPLLIGKDAELNLLNDKIFLKSSTPQDSIPKYIEVRGKMMILNSTVTSWNPMTNKIDPNGYHPRGYIMAKDGGVINVMNSNITHLGYSIGGISDTRLARSALAYYNSTNFVVANSTLAFNYYGFYSDHSTNFRILNNEVYGNTRYGLDPHTGSRDFIVDSNYVHDNGNQGIICSLGCLNVTITNNLVENNVEGIGLHWLTNSSTISNNIVRFNAKYGIFLQKQSFDNIVENNLVIANKRGIGLLEGSNDNIIRNNVVAKNIGAVPIEQDFDSKSNMITNNKLAWDGTIPKIAGLNIVNETRMLQDPHQLMPNGSP
jgi:parallel beta-helix repeat protein